MVAPLIISALIGAGASLFSGWFGSQAATKAADSESAAAKASLDLQARTLEQARSDQLPWMQAGRAALGQYMRELGFDVTLSDISSGSSGGPGDTGTVPQGGGSLVGGGLAGQAQIPGFETVDPNATMNVQPGPGVTSLGPGGPTSGFTATPGYQFMVDEAEKGAIGNLNALGMRNSGAALKSLTKLRHGLASTEYNSYLNRLAQSSGMGQAQANDTGALSIMSASNQGRTMQDMGAARASGYVGSANSVTNALGNFANNTGSALGRYNNNWQYMGAF